MTLLRRGRYLYWLTRELVRKYTRWLFLGFVIGLGSSLLLGNIYPFIFQQWFSPIRRIGIVGEFTPTTLPLSIQKHISFGLTELQTDGSAAPGLSRSWESTDSGKTYTFYLRNDLEWHNKKPVVSQDVNYNIRNVTFEPIDAHTLRVTLNEPYSPLPTLLAKPIIQSGLRGFGPYEVGRIRLKGDTIQSLRLVPVNDNSLPALEYQFYRTESLATLAYKLGDIDVIEDISSPDSLKGWGETVISEETRHDRIVALYFNLQDQLLGEKTIRQALAYSIPDLNQERAHSPIAQTSWAYSNTIRHYTYDPEHAKKLLDSAKIGSDSGELTITTFAQYVNVAQTIADSWIKLGVKTNVKVENALNGQYQILLSAQDMPPDPDQYPFWHSQQQQTNITGYLNLKIDKLLEDGRREQDIVKRKKIYADFQRFLVEDIPVMFLYHPKTYQVERQSN